MQYKYNEDKALEEIKSYIDNTYGEHYSRNKYQATEFIIDSGHGEGFCIGNILKYAQRYGKKNGKNRKDLLKVIHYAIIQMHIDEQPRLSDSIPIRVSNNTVSSTPDYLLDLSNS